MRYFPLFLDLKGRRAVIVGGGIEALNKARLLAKTDAEIAIIARESEGNLGEMITSGRVLWIARIFSPELLDDAAIVYVADREIAAEVSEAAKSRGIPVNAIDSAELSTFLTPSIVDRDPVVVAIGTEGAAPVLGQTLRGKIEAMLPAALGKLADTANGLRARVAEQVPHGERRRSFWTRFFSGPIRESFLSGDQISYARELEAALADHSSPSAGRVSLVGAGPGDPELLTLKAQRKLQEADVIVYDRLVGEGVLEYARRDAIRIAVGKTPFQPSPKQSDIDAILVREAKAGRHVVRLKGGDPYVFGRGGEEQAALVAQGIPVDVVPGITAALGCAASIGLPLTLRGQNRSLTLLTGTSEDGIADHDWRALAKPGAAFAIYMGVNAAGDISASLLDAGIDPSTPATIVENGTLPNEHVFTTTIGGLWETLTLNGVNGPAMIYVGLAKAKMSADIVPFPDPRRDFRQAPEDRVMSVAEKGQILTANRLHDGEVVFLTRAGVWSVTIDEAALAVEPQAAAALEARGKLDEVGNIVTGIYLFDAERVDGRIRAKHIRERMRALGPSVRLDLGKQSAGDGGAFPAYLGV